MILETFLLVFIFIAYIIKKSMRPKNYPPGPTPLPVIGNYFDLDRKDIQSNGIRLQKKYGDIWGIQAFFYHMVDVNGLEALKEMGENPDCQGRPDVCLIRDRFEGGHNYGLLFTELGPWKDQRNFTVRKFRDFGIGRSSHEAIIADELVLLIDKIRSLKEKPFKLEDILYLTHINLIWSVVSSKHYDYDDPDLQLIGQSVHDIIHDVKVYGSVACAIPFLRYIFPTLTRYATVKAGGRAMRRLIHEQIDEHKKTRDPNICRDFIDAYLEAIDKKENPNYTEMELVGVCMDLLLAGGDTSTGHQCFAFLFLCLNKEWQDKIYNEIMTIVGPDRQVNLEDRPRFVYAEAFLMEVTRYRTVAPTYPPHRTTKETTLGGYTIPKGTILFPNIESVFFDEKYWGDPENFRPDRFITEEGTLKKEDRLLPFGRGHRRCVGENIAKMSGFLIFTNLIQNFHFRLANESEPISTASVQGFTVAPVRYDIIATPRNEINS